MENDPKNVLILTGDAGMGHRSAAEAVQKALKKHLGEGCVIEINNPLNHPRVPNFIKDSQSDYDEIVKNLPELYKLGYKVSDATFPVSVMEGGFTILLVNIFRKILKEFNPDLIISTYPIFMAPLKVILQSQKKKIPMITVVTDLVTVHQVWFNDGATLCTVPTEGVREKALKAGLKPEQVINCGIPVDPNILALKEKPVAELREELGWQQDIPTLLVIGSPRIASMIDVVETLNYSGYVIQLALVAGGNQKLFEEFKQVDWLHPTKTYNFVENIPKLMRAADIILCKAGGLITSESLASGLPLILIHALPGQEKGNVDFVVENDAGQFCPTPLDVLKTLSCWFKDDLAELHNVSKNARILGRADAADQIAEEACRLLRSTRSQE